MAEMIKKTLERAEIAVSIMVVADKDGLGSLDVQMSKGYGLPAVVAAMSKALEVLREDQAKLKHD